MKKLIIFDLDGTLIDSAPTLANALNKTLQELHLPRYSLDTIRSWIGGGARMLVKKGLCGKKECEEVDDELFQKALQLFLRNYEKDLFTGTTLYPDVKEGLEILHEDFLLALATNKPTAFVHPLLEHFTIGNYFTISLGGDSVEHKKPHPQMLRKIVEKLSFHPDVAVMVGDSSNDLLAAKRAHIDFIGVSYGYEKLRATTIDSLPALKELL